jgi:flagellar hook protein FlgE
MSLFGALFSGVSGLAAQSDAFGAISDNITNVDTVGYKQVQNEFQTLVTEPMTATNYTSGGVGYAPTSLVDQQGLLQSSTSTTDLGITGNGLFVVNSVADPTAANGQYLFTRAGSFTANKAGDLVNTAGFFLQGWPIDANGNIPVDQSDLTELQTVNVNSLTGIATPTTAVSLEANLESSQTPGINGATLASNGSLGIAGNVDVGTATGLANNDAFTLTDGGVTDTFTYVTSGASASAGTFTTLQDLTNAINATTNLTASLSSGSTPTLTVTDPTQTSAVVVGGTLNGSGGTPLFAGSGTASYTPGDIADGTIQPQFETSLGIFDSQGGTRQLTLGFVKDGTAANQWQAEIFVQPPTDADETTQPNGLIASGTVSFNSNGTLNVAGTTLPSTLNIAWNPSLGLQASTISLGIGTDGATNGLTQFDTPSQQISSTVNGTIFGAFTGVSISSAGIVSAQFANGQTKNLYQVPLAVFNDPDALSNQTGDAYGLTPGAGQLSLLQPSTGAAGKITPSSLEASTVDLGTQFTDMIIAQQAYTAAGKIVTTADQMLDVTLQMIR